jgi:hypothetical protein
MERGKKHLTLMTIMGLAYTNVEVGYRAYNGSCIGKCEEGLVCMSAVGWTSLWMIVVGGTCGVVLGLLNEKKNCCTPTITTPPTPPSAWQMFKLTACGTVLMLILEFMFGVVLNVWLGLNIWVYNNCTDCSLYWKQISTETAGLWFLISPLVFWMDDTIRYYIYKEPAPYDAEAPQLFHSYYGAFIPTKLRLKKKSQ